ncbi:MAG TPA: hypothetical protein VF980_01605 [Thermoanaerobaculia bacterium]
MKRVSLVGAALVCAANAFAWGEAGHLISNEAATLELPTDSWMAHVGVSTAGPPRAS